MNMNKNKKEKSSQTIQGKILITTKKTGIFKTENQDLLISKNDLNTALNGDIVEIKKNKQEAKVLKIITREKDFFVGTVYRKDSSFFFKSDDTKFYPKLILQDPKKLNPSNDVKVLVKIKEWNNPKENPSGEILKIIGRVGENETEMQAILYEKGFEPEFPVEVEKEAQKIKEQAKQDFAQEIPKRKDFRDRVTFTIDPDDAKDFDDALSFKKLSNGDFEVGIHIADVTHYVKINSQIDQEATQRCTSVYLVDRTIPMLPEILSNDLCSLNPNEDKLSYSAVFVLDKNAKVKERWFGETVINSNKRFTYKTAQEILDAKNGEFYEELQQLDNLAQIMRKERIQHGAISFGSSEYKFNLDEQGKAIDVYEKEMMETNELIEDFMLLANKEVAEYIHRKEEELEIILPFVYRIHDVPKADSIHELSEFLKKIGFELKVKKNKISSNDLNNLLEKIEGLPEENLISTAMLRSMTKAIYSTQNIGHFGLAFDYYTHFTSPIRRYPDMMVHRLMKNYLTGKNLSPRSVKKYKELVSKSTQQEIAATQAERNSIKYKFTELMTSQVGNTFDGIISGITQWGVYVQIKNGAEGMISIRSLQDDYYELDTKNYCLTGKKTKNKYTLGDKIKIRCVKADTEKQNIDFELV